MIYVVGSGPTGVACASALLDAGVEVTVVDVGRQCEPGIIERVAALRRTDVSEWDPAAVDAIKGPLFQQRTSAQALKLVYGSSFPYALENSDIAEQRGTFCLQSFARGGLSNVWGAAVLPYAASDLEGWPITTKDLEPHYAAVGRLLGIAGVEDDLAPIFPFYEDPRPGVRASRQAERLEAHLGRRRTVLRTRGIFFGRSRLAVRTAPDESGPGCQTVGLCLTGCPFGAIYNAGDSLRALMRSPRLRYLDGWKVERVSEHPSGHVTITARRPGAVEEREFTAARVFLAAGVLSTVRIVLASLRGHNAPVRVRYQPYFLLPMLGLRNVPGVAEERLHTLAQLFLEIRDSGICRGWMHLQLYTYNEAMRDRLRQTLPAGLGLTRWAERVFLGRLLAVQGYLPSDPETAIEVRLTGAEGPEGQRLALRGRLPASARRRIRRVCWKLLRNAEALGLLAVLPMVHVGEPGEGNHVGAVFPMSRAPQPLETDLLGRLPGFRRVHLVDASVLPSLPATTLTYGAMANAHRIGAWAVR